MSDHIVCDVCLKEIDYKNEPVICIVPGVNLCSKCAQVISDKIGRRLYPTNFDTSNDVEESNND